jgi:L-rhamnose isomerase/sugar isomerase
VECIDIGRKLGSSALTVWIADGSNFPGQSNLNAAFDRYIESMRLIYERLPQDWSLFLEHKLYEPAFYSTVIADWGSSLMAATELGPQAKCLVDLGHHAPTTNIEQIVARLVRVEKLAGFHFNDSKYGDDDLDSGSTDPFRLFLIFNELVDAEMRKAGSFSPAYMIDQSHNVTDPIESLIASATEIERAYVQASLVDREAVTAVQEKCDAMEGHRLVKQAFITDVSPILAEARRRRAGAIDPLALYRASNYRAAKAKERPASGVATAGIV